MKVRIEGSVCCGHGRCYMLAPDVFTADDHGRVLQVDMEVDVLPEHELQVEHAALGCPEQAIALYRTS